MSGNSWVTLATNDSYSLGSLVLARSLKRVGTVHNLTVLITPGVSAAMRNQLASVFNVIEEVNVLDSNDEKNLALLTRPELGITFTKLHCWRLTQFSKCVFLDADVLVLRNCDELFDREELSAAPDVGWPDCFNSGVFVYRPSIDTYNSLISFAVSQGSFDGGDQGLLNQYFSDWATKDISRHLPFIYNMCSSATYSYLPAFKQFGQNVKIVHFIGSAKPWLQYLDSETRQVRPSPGSEHLQGLLQLWWDIFCNDVHSTLSSEMVGLAGALSQLTLGVARSPEQVALEEHMRKQAWEHGNIDYMGRDSFDNIWRKICQTLAGAPSADPLPEKSKQSAQASSIVVDTISQGVSSADDPSSLPEPTSVTPALKESAGVTLSSTDAETLSVKPNVSAESVPSDSVSPPGLTTVSSSPEAKTELTSPITPVTTTNELELLSSLPAPKDSFKDQKVVAPLTEMVSSVIGISTESFSEVTQFGMAREAIVPQKEESQIQKTDTDSNSVESREKTESKECPVPDQIPLQVVPLAKEVPSQEIVELLETVSVPISIDGTGVAVSIIPKQTVDAPEQLQKSELYASPLVSLVTTVSSVDSQLTSLKSPGVSESLVEAQIESAHDLAGVEALPTEFSAKVDAVLIDPKPIIDQPISSTTQSSTSTLDPTVEAQKVTVTAPTPPTSPTDSSSVAPLVTSLVEAQIESAHDLAGVEALPTEFSAKVDAVLIDPKPIIDQPISSTTQSSTTSTLDPTVEAQKVTVTEPTPPTSPTDSSSVVPPAPPTADTLSIEPSIPATPPVGIELPSTETSLSSGPVAASPASVPPGVVSPPESSSRYVDPKAPIPPKRRHKPSQNVDQAGSKSGKAQTKTPKGKK